MNFPEWFNENYKRNVWIGVLFAAIVAFASIFLPAQIGPGLAFWSIFLLAAPIILGGGMIGGTSGALLAIGLIPKENRQKANRSWTKAPFAIFVLGSSAAVAALFWVNHLCTRC